MSRTLTVHVNRGRGDSVEVDRDRLDVTGPFTLKLQNHGPPTHVHLHLDDALSDVARVDATNVYLEEGDVKLVNVRVSETAVNVRGELDVVTGYGRERAVVSVFVDFESPQETGVDVDESLGKVQSAGGDDRAGREWLVPVLVVLVGVVVTVAAVLVADRIVASMVAVVALLGSVSAATFLYRQA